MKRYKHRKCNYSESDDFDDGIIGAVITMIAVYLLLWIIFWIGIVVGVIVIIYFIHRLNKRFKLYNTKFYRAPIVIYLITSVGMIIGGWQLSFSFGKIDTTFRDRAKETSNYITIKGKKLKINIEPNVEGIIQKTLIQK